MNDKSKQKEYFQSYYQRNKDKLKKRRKELYYEKGDHKKRSFRKNMTPEQLEMLKTRNCPDCNTLIKYDNISNKQRADKKNAPCEKCQGEKLSENTRGVRLTKEERALAAVISKTLFKIKARCLAEPFSVLLKNGAAVIHSQPLMSLEYLEIADAFSLQPIKDIHSSKSAVVCIAVKIGAVRLIDNVVLY
jgi:hypothetical protein